MKHIADARNDPKVRRVERSLGEAGYARLFKLYEVIAQYCGDGDKFEPRLDLKSVATDIHWLADELRISVEDAEKTLSLFAEIGLINSESWAERVVYVPRMLELRDEWSRRLAAKQLRSNSGATRESRRRKSRVTTSSELDSELELDSDSEQEKTSCATSQSAVAPPTPPVIALPLNDNSEFPITQQAVAEWKQLYPGVDIPQALRSMRGWLLSHKANRKTRRGIEAFITSWLNKEQNNSKPGVNRFENKRPTNAVNSGRGTDYGKHAVKLPEL